MKKINTVSNAYMIIGSIPLLFILPILIINVLMGIYGVEKYESLMFLFGPEQGWTDGTSIYLALRDYWNYFFWYVGITLLGLLSTILIIKKNSVHLYWGTLLLFSYELLVGVLSIIIGCVTYGKFPSFSSWSMTLLFMWYDSPYRWAIITHFILIGIAILNYILVMYISRNKKLNLVNSIKTQ